MRSIGFGKVTFGFFTKFRTPFWSYMLFELLIARKSIGGAVANFSQGRFRHGSKFLRWRPDKDPKQCTVDQVLPRRTKGKRLEPML